MTENLVALAVSWWLGDGDSPAYERVYEIVNRDRELAPRLIAALSDAAPPGALQYIGTSVVEDLAFQVRAS